MTWIRTIPYDKAGPELRKAYEAQRELYPSEYALPFHPRPGNTDSIVQSHSLIPDALNHAFAAYGALMSPDLPLSRRQHEMIATVVSSVNHCFY